MTLQTRKEIVDFCQLSRAALSPADRRGGFLNDTAEEPLSVTNYPQIAWSKPYTPEGMHPSKTFGLVQARFGPNGYRLRKDNSLIPFLAPEAAGSHLVFGIEASNQIHVFSDKLFNWNQYRKINASGQAARRLVVILGQREKASQFFLQVGDIQQVLVNSPKPYPDFQARKQATTLENMRLLHARRLQPKRLLDVITKLMNMGVPRVSDEVYKLDLKLQEILDNFSSVQTSK